MKSFIDFQKEEVELDESTHRIGDYITYGPSGSNGGRIINKTATHVIVQPTNRDISDKIENKDITRNHRTNPITGHMKKEEVELDEATVKTQKYSWGTMKTVHQGSDFSIPLHPEHHQEIAKLKDQQEHKFKDETGRHWTAKRSGDDVHFKGANGGNSTTVKHSTMSEEVELDEDTKYTPRFEYRQKVQPNIDKHLDDRKTAGAHTAITYHKQSDGSTHAKVQYRNISHTNSSGVGPIQHKHFSVNKDHSVTPIKINEEQLDEARGKVVASYIQKAKEAMKKKIDMKRKTAQLNDPNSAEKKIVKESDLDEEQLDELSKDTLASYEKKSRVAAHKHALASELKGLAADPAGSYAHKMMADKRHAGWKVAVKKLHTEESDLEEEQLDELSPKTLGSYVKNAHQDQKERSFSAGYNNNETDKEILKDKKRDKNISKAVNKLVHKANEELEIDEASRAKLSNYISAAKSDEKKDRSAGIALAQKKKWGDPKYGTVAAKVPANEEVEAIDEIKLADLPVRKIQGRAYGASTPEPHAVDTMEGPRDSELKKIAAEKKKKKFSEMVNLYQDKGLKSLSEMLAKEEVTEDEFNKEIEDAKEKNAGKKKNTEIAKGAVQAVKNEETEVVEYALDVDAINGVAIENIEERHMTEPETKKKEEIVKSMKKGLSGFKDRYGDRAKEVMYATATARAKGE